MESIKLFLISEIFLLIIITTIALNLGTRKLWIVSDTKTRPVHFHCYCDLSDMSLKERQSREV